MIDLFFFLLINALSSCIHKCLYLGVILKTEELKELQAKQKN